MRSSTLIDNRRNSIGFRSSERSISVNFQTSFYLIYIYILEIMMISAQRQVPAPRSQSRLTYNGLQFPSTRWRLRNKNGTYSLTGAPNHLCSHRESKLGPLDYIAACVTTHTYYKNTQVIKKFVKRKENVSTICLSRIFPKRMPDYARGNFSGGLNGCELRTSKSFYLKGPLKVEQVVVALTGRWTTCDVISFHSARHVDT